MMSRLYDLIENDGQVFASGWRWVYRRVACGKVSDLGDRTASADCG
jgi:hypothetical protein